MEIMITLCFMETSINGNILSYSVFVFYFILAKTQIAIGFCSSFFFGFCILIKFMFLSFFLCIMLACMKWSKL